MDKRVCVRSLSIQQLFVSANIHKQKSRKQSIWLCFRRMKSVYKKSRYYLNGIEGLNTLCPFDVAAGFGPLAAFDINLGAAGA